MSPQANAAHAPACPVSGTGISVSLPHLHRAVLQLRGLVQAAAAAAPVQVQAAAHDRGLAASSQWHNGHLQGSETAVSRDQTRQSGCSSPACDARDTVRQCKNLAKR